MSGRLAGKVAVITGASSGIGASMAEMFCREGARVVAVGTSGRQDDVAKRIGDACVPFHGDVTKTGDIQAMLKEAVTRFGKLDVLVNNAGTEGAIIPTENYPEEEFDRVWAVNARSTFLGMRYAIPLMRENGGGSIVNVSSMSSVVAFPSMPAYCAAKSAVSMLTKVVAVENATFRIRANAICPGPVKTPMTAQMKPEYIAAVNKAVPLNRMAAPEEIGQLGVFLASDESSFITATSIVIDGGYTSV